MRKKRIELKYYQTYYYANIVQNISLNPYDYLQNLEGFWCDDEYKSFIIPFSKHSIFHQFIEFIIRWVLYEENHEFDLQKQKESWRESSYLPQAERKTFLRIPIEDDFLYYKLKHETFIEYLKSVNKIFGDADEDDIYEYYNGLMLGGPLDELIEKITKEVFHIMFLNRKTLHHFNVFIAGVIQGRMCIKETTPEERAFIKRNGVLKRVRIPEWAKLAIFHRDKGHCTICNKDVSGVISLQNDKNFDHIVPLAKGGINDISNLQLLCKECNSKKKHHYSFTSEYYERWY